jgi:hypothetical protein
VLVVEMVADGSEAAQTVALAWLDSFVAVDNVSQAFELVGEVP